MAQLATEEVTLEPVTEITVDKDELNLIKVGLATVIANANSDEEIAALTPTIKLLKDIVSIQLDLGW